MKVIFYRIKESETELWSWVAVTTVLFSTLLLFSYAQARPAGSAATSAADGGGYDISTGAAISQIAGDSKVASLGSVYYNGGEAIAKWSQCGLTNPKACADAVLASQMTLDARKAWKSAKKAEAATICPGGSCNPATNTSDPYSNPYVGSTPEDNEVDKISKKAEEIATKLENKGYNYNPGTGKLETPAGSFYPTEIDSASEAQEKLGMSAEKFEEYEASSKASSEKNEAKARARMAKLRNKLGRGHGGGRRIASVPSSESVDFDFSKFFPQKEKLKDRGVAGLTVQYGNQRIGVAADNIFQMMDRQYKSQSSRGQFIHNPNGHTQLKKPTQSRWYIEAK